MRDYPMTAALMAINISIYLLMGITGRSLFEPNSAQLVQWGGNYGPLTLSGEYWRLLTAGFLHAGIAHIAFNMWALFSLGKLVERLFGSISTVLIYLLTAVGGNLLSLAYEPARNTVGASGALFGLAGALLVGIKFGDLKISAGEKKSLFGSLVFFIAISFYMGQGGNTDNMCHLGGFVSGLIIGLPLASFFSSSKSVNAIARSVVLGLAALLLFGAGRELVERHGHKARLSAALRAFRNDEIPKVIEILERDSASGQSSADTFSLLGYAYENSQQPQKALAAYQHALALDPEDEYAKEALQRMQSGQEDQPVK
jgi:membrane associated rhomboid family serine protease